jgi:PAS domain S-box-containing protein
LIVRRLALVFSLSVTIALPGAYFYLSYTNLTEHVNTLAEVKAGVIGILSSGNPELWKYNSVRMDELLHRGPFLLTHVRVTIRDSADNALLTVGEPPEAPILTLSAPVYDFGREVGRVEIAHSYRAVILGTLLTALLGLLLGILVYAVPILPLRALRRASAALAKEHAALSTSEEHYRALFERAAEGIMTFTPDGRLVTVNEAFARMHGYSVDEIRAINLNDLDTQKTRHLIAERMPHILSGEALTFEVEHYHKNGHAFPLEVSSSLISSDGEPHIQALHRDISERRKQQSLIEERNELLTRQKVELEATLGRVRRLEGLLSICMQCKKIRTENNDWHQLERYIGENSDAVFSHGLCPDCLEAAMKKLD